MPKEDPKKKKKKDLEELGDSIDETLEVRGESELKDLEDLEGEVAEAKKEKKKELEESGSASIPSPKFSPKNLKWAILGVVLLLLVLGGAYLFGGIF